MTELHGEKIDIVDYSPEPAEFVAHALSPARVSKVNIVDLQARVAQVIVPDYQLSLAIGKEGQNVRLAARLTGWRIDIRADTADTGPAVASAGPDDHSAERNAAAAGGADSGSLDPAAATAGTDPGGGPADNGGPGDSSGPADNGGPADSSGRPGASDSAGL
jgi:N utilization substance protein A